MVLIGSFVELASSQNGTDSKSVDKSLKKI